jgi:hypothetical protein
MRMLDREATPTTEPRRRCDHADRRVIRLRWPYAEAGIVRARLVTENGHRFAVSPLFSIDGGWAFSICRECARDEHHSASAVAAVVQVASFLIGSDGGAAATARRRPVGRRSRSEASTSRITR